MPLEEFLLPKEEVHLRVPTYYGNQWYELVVTNKRLILYARRGLLFKKDDFISIKMAERENVVYKEEGLISKKGILLIDTVRRRIVLRGGTRDMKVAYQNIMQFWEG